MIETIIAGRYAKALLDVVMEDGDPGETRERLEALARAIGEDRDIRDFLANPEVPAEQKREVLEQALETLGASQALISFARVVCDALRAGLLPEIAAEFTRLANEAQNVLSVRVESAAPVGPDVENRIREIVASRTGKRVHLRVEVRPETLGGMALRIGNRVVDGTLRARVEQMRRTLE